MIRVIGVLLVAGLLLGACGSISASKALTAWVVQSGYLSTAKSLTNDAQRSANALKIASTSNVDLHTVCAVLDLETEQANSSLPTPDNQATSLLSRAYTNLGAGASECYGAAAYVAKRAKALHSLTSGVSYLAEASARIASASTP